jgi:hypothetical protein
VPFIPILCVACVCVCVCVVGLGLEVRASHLQTQRKLSTAWAKTSVHFALVIFGDGVLKTVSIGLAWNYNPILAFLNISIPIDAHLCVASLSHIYSMFLCTSLYPIAGLLRLSYGRIGSGCEAVEQKDLEKYKFREA